MTLPINFFVNAILRNLRKTKSFKIKKDTSSLDKYLKQKSFLGNPLCQNQKLIPNVLLLGILLSTNKMPLKIFSNNYHS